MQKNIFRASARPSPADDNSFFQEKNTSDPNTEAAWEAPTDAWRSAGFGPIMSCRLGDFIDEAAAAGDPVAIEVLQRMRPREVPPAIAKFYRDRDFNKLAVLSPRPASVH